MIEFLYLLLFVFLFRCFDLCRFSFAAGFPGNGPPRRGRPSKRAWLDKRTRENPRSSLRDIRSASEPVFPREISPCINLFLPASLIDLDIFLSLFQIPWSVPALFLPGIEQPRKRQLEDPAPFSSYSVWWSLFFFGGLSRARPGRRRRRRCTSSGQSWLSLFPLSQCAGVQCRCGTVALGWSSSFRRPGSQGYVRTYRGRMGIGRGGRGGGGWGSCFQLSCAARGRWTFGGRVGPAALLQMERRKGEKWLAVWEFGTWLKGFGYFVPAERGGIEGVFISPPPLWPCCYLLWQPQTVQHSLECGDGASSLPLLFPSSFSLPSHD